MTTTIFITRWALQEGILAFETEDELVEDGGSLQIAITIQEYIDGQGAYPREHHVFLTKGEWAKTEDEARSLVAEHARAEATKLRSRAKRLEQRAARAERIGNGEPVKLKPASRSNNWRTWSGA